MHSTKSNQTLMQLLFQGRPLAKSTTVRVVLQQGLNEAETIVGRAINTYVHQRIDFSSVFFFFF